MSFSSLAASLPVDGRQSATALAIARGTTRLLHSFGYSVVSELSLPSGRRADRGARRHRRHLDGRDQWLGGRPRADRNGWTTGCLRPLFFATTLEVPCEIFPKDTGLVVADAFGASIDAKRRNTGCVPDRQDMTLALPAARLCVFPRSPTAGPSGMASEFRP